MSAPSYSRNLRDAAFVATKALPAAAATAYTDSLDLAQTTVQSLEQIEFEIAVPALPALVEAKTVTISVQDSADNSSFAAVDPAITTVITGGTGNGAAAKTVRFRLPSQTRRYVRLSLVVLTAGGDNTGVSATLSALF
jgi:hypothetical protein